MKKLMKDPLLAISWVILTLVLAIFLIGAAIGILGAFAVPFVPGQVESVIEQGSSTTIAQASWGFVGLTLFIGALLGTFAWFTYLLRQIVISVGDGDPFNIDNSKRLNWMAWLSIAISFAIPSFIVATQQMSAILGEDGIQEEIGFSANGLLLALILFILARVFKHGATMREDLEGTV